MSGVCSRHKGYVPDCDLCNAVREPDELDALDEYDEAMKPGAWEAYNSLVKQGIIKHEN